MSLSGIIILDKPKDKSSAFIARLIGKKIGAKKVGHLGTLDPFATGVLPIAINEATKLIPYINSRQKTYEFEIVFGEKKNTADITGETIQTSQIIPTYDDILKIIPLFIGQIKQIPHIYSAIRINGRKSYEIVRRGGTPQIPAREVTIFSLEILGQTSDKSCVFRASVSPGTYIRTLAEDIADKLQTKAYVKMLRRISDGIFHIKNAITIDELEKNYYNVENVICGLEEVLDDIPVIFIDSHEVNVLKNGQSLPAIEGEDGIVAVSSSDGFFAIVEIRDGIMSPKRIIRFIY